MQDLIRAIAYLRCSSDRQAEKEASLPAQRADIERRAAQDRAVVLRWFQDDGISGRSIEDRDGVQEVIRYCHANRGRIHRLYVWDLRRFARNREEAYYIRKELRAAKVELVSITQPSVDDPGTNALIESLYDGIAEMESHYLSKVVRRGQRQALDDGWWPYPRAPYGYRIAAHKNSRGATRFKLEVDPEKAEIVRRVFSLYLAGSGAKAICALLNREGVTPPSRSDAPKQRDLGWRPKHVLTIIHNSAYLGVARWAGQVANEAHHPPLLDREVWERTQAIAGERRRKPTELASMNSGKDTGVFRPWLRCATCGGAMMLNRGGVPNNRVWYYACRTRAENNAACRGMTVRVDELDEALLGTLEREVLTPERVRTVIEETLAGLQETANGELAERRRFLQARIDELTTQLQRLARAVAAGTLDPDDVGKLSTPLREQREELRAELTGLPEPRPIPTLEEVNPEAFRAAIVERWRASDLAAQRKALDRIIEEIRLEPGLATIRYAWKAPPASYTYQDPAGPP